MHKAWWMWVVGAAALLGLLPLGCGGGEGSGTGAGGSTSTSTAGTGGSDGGALIGGSGGSAQSLTLTPSSAEIVVTNGASSPVDFDLLANGTSVVANWSVDKTSVAKVDADGVVSAIGDKGGPVIVTAQYGAEMRSATVTVKIVTETNPGGIADADIGVLKGPTDPNAGVVWLYPYDETVFPKGIYPPELMWDGATAGDEYYIRYRTPYVDVGIFTKVDPPSRFLLDEATWHTVTESGKGEDVHLTIARLVPGQAKATLAVDNTWKIAPGALRGFVYYWSNSLGRVLRIDPGKGTAPEDFLLAAGISQPCSTCHTVSADGLTLVIGGDVASSVFNLLDNTTTLQLGNIGKPVRNWAMPAVSPDGKVLIENNAPLPGPPGGSDGMWNPQTGTKLVGTGLDGIFLDMPAFAPSGKAIAAVDHSSHGLVKYAFDPATNMVSGFTNLVEPGGDPSLNAICFPSVAPTSQSTWATYHRGSYPGSLDTRTGPGDLYLANMDAPGTEVRLRAANGDDYPYPVGDRDRHFNYEPTFAPQEAGGYHWIVFTSRRTYGNRLTGDKSVVKQLWITAVDLDPKPGEDPSHPAFWIPGQDANLNMRGFWAQKNCVVAAQACQNDSDCCGGICQNGVCAGMTGECSEEGGPCTINADCCDLSEICLPDGTCGNDIPQ